MRRARNTPRVPRAKRHRWKDSRSDPANACTRASAEKDVEHRSRSNTPAGRELLPVREYKMTFSTGSCMVKMKYTEDEVSTMIAESREACKRLRKLGMIGRPLQPHASRN